MVSAVVTLLVIGVFAAGGWVVIREAKRVQLWLWLPGFLARKRVVRRAKAAARTMEQTHILFCMVDHFEPISAGSTKEQERSRMNMWLDQYPRLAGQHRDSHGRPPQHTWFYPIENYASEYLDGLGELCRQGLGEIEVHLHHGHDTSETLRVRIQAGLAAFEKHGAQKPQGFPAERRYGFIHGNMALDNSRYDPAFCGVNDELKVLCETGCYADFSLPTVPCVSQPRMVNTIYYALEDPDKPKSHDYGVEIEMGGHPSGDLLLIPGPLALNWRQRKYGIVPRIENGEIQGSSPPTAHRVRLWIEQHIHVKGRPDWVVVKVSCHGAEERNWNALFGPVADEMYRTLEAEYRDQGGYQLHYVTARELYNIVKAAEAGCAGNPTAFRDFVIPPYEINRVHSVSRK